MQRAEGVCKRRHYLCGSRSASSDFSEEEEERKMAEDFGSPYQGQEDINDKLLLDLAWERQQKKVSALRADTCPRAPAKLYAATASGLGLRERRW